MTQFLSWHAAADDRADWNHDGSVNYADTTAYLNAKAAAGTFGGRGVLSSLALDIRFGYAGYQWDQPLSTYHARRRVYDPFAGRWINRDPIEYSFTFNLYEYAYDSPLNFADPYGLYGVGGIWRNVCTVYANGGTTPKTASVN